jgi:hypothetical protein
LKMKILTVWKGKFWQFEKENFDSLKRKILTVWKGKFWQSEKENFDSLKRKILTVWKGLSVNFANQFLEKAKTKNNHHTKYLPFPHIFHMKTSPHKFIFN